MGWETSLLTHIRYNKKTYDSKYKVLEDYNLNQSVITTLQTELMSLALMTEPKKWLKDDEEEPLYVITSRTKELLEELEARYIENYKLGLLLEEWDNCHDENGLAIPDPKNISWDSSFLDGDFIKTKEKEEEEKDES